MTDEEYVRSVWKQPHIVDFDGSMLIRGFTDPDWSAFAEFTRARLEQVRQLREEMGIVISSQMTAANYANDLWPGDSDRQKWLHRYELWSGILTILEAERARLTAGMTPEALQ